MEARNNRMLSFSDERGMTLVEILAAMAISTIVLGSAMINMFMVRTAYIEDIARLRLNSNLRSAMDMVSMNVRQAGENLQASFPAILLEDGASGAPDDLYLRRNVIPDVLTLCQDVSSGTGTLYVSSTSVDDPECVSGNVTSLFEAFEAYRDETEDGGQDVRIYIYNQVTEEGEFVDYNEEDTELGSGEYYLSTSNLENSYDALTTNIYVLEEFLFQVFPEDESLNLYVDGEVLDFQAVAFSVTDFQVSLELEDESVVTSIDTSDTYDWQDIKQISITLSGQEEWKGKTITSSMTSAYFPRNVLSY